MRVSTTRIILYLEYKLTLMLKGAFGHKVSCLLSRRVDALGQSLHYVVTQLPRGHLSG